ncbi:MAG: YraN family protein, partial [Acidobacteria bacterium]|nr:YraN family protein [Acidobacteriota bacterium]
MFARLLSLLRRSFSPAALGRISERRAALYLRLRGYRVVARNVRYRDGEIDLVVRRGRRVAFVEVKSRQGRGAPAEAVGAVKQMQVARMAERYLAGRRFEGCSLHFDVVTVFWDGWLFHIRHLPDAFYLEGRAGER